MRPKLEPTVRLVVPGPSDEGEFLDVVEASADLYQGWVSPPSDSDAFQNYLKRISSPNHRGFVARDLKSGAIAGVVNINDIRLGSMLSASLGYYALGSDRAKGAMTEAVGQTVDHAFGTLGLHRIEANIQPGNMRSRALVQRLGFGLEGFSPRYLYISGNWRDHERWAVLREDW
jgi:[ribosomal protein S5]-alanine N-acetyltransferase